MTATVSQIFVAFDLIWSYYLRPRIDGDSMVLTYEYSTRLCMVQCVFALTLTIPSPHIFQTMLTAIYVSLMCLMLPSVVRLCMMYPNRYGKYYLNVLPYAVFIVVAFVTVVLIFGYGMLAMFDHVK